MGGRVKKASSSSPAKTLVNQDLKQLDLNLDMQRQLGMVWHPARIQSKAAEELIHMMQ